MSEKQNNRRELNQEEKSMVNGGAVAENDQTEKAIPGPIDPVVPTPVPDDTEKNYGLNCKCGHCGYTVNTYDAAGKYYFECPNCNQRSNWIYIYSL